MLNLPLNNVILFEYENCGTVELKGLVTEFRLAGWAVFCREICFHSTFEAWRKLVKLNAVSLVVRNARNLERIKVVVIAKEVMMRSHYLKENFLGHIIGMFRST